MAATNDDSLWAPNDPAPPVKQPDPATDLKTAVGQVTTPTTPSGTETPWTMQPTTPSFNDVNGLYKQYLGRDASQDEYQNWSTGKYGATDLAGITGQIKASGEAQAFAGKSGSTGTSAVPSYVNLNDPTQAAVWKAYQAKGITPGGPSGAQADFQYWVDHYNAGSANPGNADWWASRMAQSQGGVGDYQERPEAGGATGGTSAGGWWGGGSPTVASTNSSTSTLSPEDLARRETLFSTLDNRIKQSTVVDPNDPNIRQQADANSANTERQRRQYMQNLAEAKGPYGTNTAEDRLTSEQTGQANGAFEAGLVGNELTARRTEIQNALTQEGSMLSDDQKNALQIQLANLDAAIRSKQLDQQNTQFGQQLAQQSTQFGQNLDFNMQDRTAYWNNVGLGNMMPAGA